MKNDKRTIGRVSLGGLAPFDLNLHLLESCPSSCGATADWREVTLSVGSHAQILQALRTMTDAEFAKLLRLMSAMANQIASAYLRTSLQPRYAGASDGIISSNPQGYSTPASVRVRTFDERSLGATVRLLETVAHRIAQQSAAAGRARPSTANSRPDRDISRDGAIGTISLDSRHSLDLKMLLRLGCPVDKCQIAGKGSLWLYIGDSGQIYRMLTSGTKMQQTRRQRSMVAVAHEIAAQTLLMSTGDEYADVAAEITVSRTEGSCGPAKVEAYVSEEQSLEATALLVEAVALSIARARPPQRGATAQAKKAAGRARKRS